MDNFFIVKNILYSLLEIFEVSKQISYSSIIIHSYSPYKFNESYFVTSPIGNMEIAFAKYKEKNNDVLNFRIFKNDDIYIQSSDPIFLGSESRDYETIISLLHKNEGSYNSICFYGGTIHLFNVLNFKKEWKVLLDKYFQQNIIVNNNENNNIINNIGGATHYQYLLNKSLYYHLLNYK